MLLGLTFAAGCRPGDSVSGPNGANESGSGGGKASVDAAADEPSWSTQLADVRTGRADRIVLLDTPVGEAELAQLAATDGTPVLPLRHLELPRSAATDRSAEVLAQLTSLEVLVLGDTTIRSTGLQALAKLKKLQRLNLAATDADDAGLAALASLPELTLLRIGGPRLTGTGFERLADCPRLRFLLVRNTPLGDDDLDRLSKLRRLESLYLEGTRITETGARKLQSERPELHVHFP